VITRVAFNLFNRARFYLPLTAFSTGLHIDRRSGRCISYRHEGLPL